MYPSAADTRDSQFRFSGDNGRETKGIMKAGIIPYLSLLNRER
ncbi:hypothetical protein XSR1_70055 [Xenorhabdus szentirmaii DSM 16338]|uniref:Uncharacterized protein n=1 Tax=Xenorhabdus szentirmaii DSM 16338 TaxID=1427518 RepID=W1J753_9GAMM|nr:hypothetical protein XSR1_70055 [Xenorhabdus szentirmaii DSM 16338]